MRYLHALVALVILCTAAATEPGTSVYRNKEYGILLHVPSGAWICSVPYSGANHGVALLLGTKDERLCKQSSGKRWVSVFASYNVSDETKTLHQNLEWHCKNNSAGGVCGQAPVGLSVHGLRSETARLDYADGSMEVYVVTQAGKPDPDFDPSVPSINYNVSLHTNAQNYDADLEVFRAVLNNLKIAPGSH